MKEACEKIKTTLWRNSLTHVWLINRLEDRGIKTEKTSLSSILRGVRRGPKAEEIINASLLILDDYERKMKEG